MRYRAEFLIYCRRCELRCWASFADGDDCRHTGTVIATAPAAQPSLFLCGGRRRIS